MTAPSQEAVSAIPDAEVRELVARLKIWADDPMWADHAEVPKRLLSKAAEMIEHLASRPSREEIRDEALEEAAKIADSDYRGPSSGAFLDGIVEGRRSAARHIRAALRSRTPAPSRNQEDAV